MQLDHSDKILLLGNLLTIIFAIVLGYNFAVLIWIYLIESIIIGIFHFLKLIIGAFRSKTPNDLQLNFIKFFYPVFFVIHYGMFHATYLIFLAVLPWFGIGYSEISGIVVGIIIFLFSHAFSFHENLLQKKWCIPSGIRAYKQQFAEPYSRIIPMHITIIASGFIIAFTDRSNEFGLLILFMVLKTFSDLYFHRKKHRD